MEAVRGLFRNASSHRCSKHLNRRGVPKYEVFQSKSAMVALIMLIARAEATGCGSAPKPDGSKCWPHETDTVFVIGVAATHRGLAGTWPF